MNVNRSFVIISIVLLLLVSSFQINSLTIKQSKASDSIYPLSLVDAYGRNVTFESEPVSIVSIAPSATEVIFAVGAGANVVAVDAYSNYPLENTTGLTKIGTFPTLDIEAIVSINPGIVFAAGIISQDDITTLENLEVTVFVLAPSDIFDVLDDISTVGLITNHVDDATTLVESLKERIDVISDSAASFPHKPKVYVEASADGGYWTFGNGSYGHAVIELAGGINIAENATGLYPSVDSEFIIAQNPDVIFYTEGPWTTTNASSIGNRTGWTAIKAVLTGRIYPLNEDWISRGGPRIINALEEVNEKLAEEATNTVPPPFFPGFEWFMVPVLVPIVAVIVIKRRRMSY
ncbi:MAG: ABC transporter substrate-binding protein [Candidatus Hodarchaeales archaeon]|jgi:iron complex transport system substrate-binding protein